MIKTFGDKETETVFNREPVRSLPRSIFKSAVRKLWLIHATINIIDLRAPPGNRLEQLQGDRAGQYSIRINDQWRVCFSWHDGNAYNVEIVDYH